MLRAFTILAVLTACPTFAQTITDGSDRSLPRDQVAKMMQSVGGNPDLGARAQIRGLHPVNLNNGVYYCGQANAGGGWQPFYYDTYSGVSSIGIRASGICGG